ncbi:paraplegin-like [Halichondria panicea]|uniref:paraplegin-like n=1 Tax=Halichondria panicea TaxID=6063 RepID=UPI00312B86CF
MYRISLHTRHTLRWPLSSCVQEQCRQWPHQSVLIGASPHTTMHLSVSSRSLAFSPLDMIRKAKPTIITDPTQLDTSFADVAGMEEAKNEVVEFVDYLKYPQRYSELGARTPKGALLYGPPGTGKTLLARALAAEACVPFLSIAGSDFVEVYAGTGAARVRDLFSQSRKHAPCIMYIDEIDAVGKTRRSSISEGHNEQENTLNQLLVEMDGITPLESVVILASTNRVDILDQALLRPGRFDRQISIDLPTLAERKAIFELYLGQVLLDPDRGVTDYSARLAALTPGNSGADIANIVNEAALHAARYKKSGVREDDFEYAVERIIAGMEKKNHVMSCEERRIVAYHEAGHALVGWCLEHTDPIMKVSITPRTKGALGFSQYLPSDQKLYTTEQLFDRMSMALGGRAAEAITFNRITTGARDDLEKVTEMAYRQVAEFGMSPVIGHISLPPQAGGKRSYSQKLSRMIDEEVKELVNRAYLRAKQILEEHTEQLEKVAVSLLEKEVVNYKDLVDLIGPMAHEKRLHQHSELAEMWTNR